MKSIHNALDDAIEQISIPFEYTITKPEDVYVVRFQSKDQKMEVLLELVICQETDSLSCLVLESKGFREYQFTDFMDILVEAFD